MEKSNYVFISYFTSSGCTNFIYISGAVEFKAKFEECVNSLSTENGDDDKLVNALSGLDVKEEKDKNDNTTEKNKNADSTENKTAESTETKTDDKEENKENDDANSEK